MTKRKSTKQDMYQQVTDSIVAMLEDAQTWDKPWSFSNTGEMPLNPIGKRSYRGVNIPILFAAQQANGWESNQFATFKQWIDSDIGAKIKKGSKATTIVFWKSFNLVDDNGEPVCDDNGKPQVRMYSKPWKVFNREQIQGGDFSKIDEPIALPNKAEKIERAEKYFQNFGVDIRHGGNRAFYRPSDDFIQMPPMEAFKDTLGYYSTLAHESVHATGHKDRLDRLPEQCRFGSPDYIREELVAEMGSAYVLNVLGISHTPRQDHANYLAAWVKLLKNDNTAIFKAASQAQKALDYLEACQVKQADNVAA